MGYYEPFLLFEKRKPKRTMSFKIELKKEDQKMSLPKFYFINAQKERLEFGLDTKHENLKVMAMILLNTGCHRIFIQVLNLGHSIDVRMEGQSGTMIQNVMIDEPCLEILQRLGWDDQN